MTDLPVDVIRSTRRKRTAQAYESDGRLRVLIPAGLDPEREQRIVEELVARANRKMVSREIDLVQRAHLLADRYDLPRPLSVVWSDRQMKRWGSCTPSAGRIRISRRLATMPEWVLDSVLVHELAHLAVPGHGKDFKALVARYAPTERARGYLMAKDEERGRRQEDAPPPP